ncbi:hypothetical protein M406DRAFT_330252 [Cryphonectria parasitica EP155]|uniref:Uncharacterized protein n=1 Tax=Cryphonectria parasitica (strain ATCC 38755 / EP155) TaxID=660469 RepID=A0A9P5CQP0_CRYP1|nr:uncharacterized protein M406DRAFT_330252 [Cryphonectria parasitica EP155]KAF3766431.1 hypothetical protein M406DRAFT_330252 [Cryphonectria parasitica EP155]
MQSFRSFATLCLVFSCEAAASLQAVYRQQSITTVLSPQPTFAQPHVNDETLSARSTSQKDTFDFDVRSDQIVPMMDALADLSVHISESREAAFYKKDDDDPPPFKCHCKCSLLGGCECWCGDRDTKKGSGNN